METYLHYCFDHIVTNLKQTLMKRIRIIDETTFNFINDKLEIKNPLLSLK